MTDLYQNCIQNKYTNYSYNTNSAKFDPFDKVYAFNWQTRDNNYTLKGYQTQNCLFLLNTIDFSQFTPR